MKIKHAFSSTSSSTKLLEPDEKRIYHLGSLILGIIIFISFSFICLTKMKNKTEKEGLEKGKRRK